MLFIDKCAYVLVLSVSMLCQNKKVTVTLKERHSLPVKTKDGEEMILNGRSKAHKDVQSF